MADTTDLRINNNNNNDDKDIQEVVKEQEKECKVTEEEVESALAMALAMAENKIWSRTTVDGILNDTQKWRQTRECLRLFSFSPQTLKIEIAKGSIWGSWKEELLLDSVLVVKWTKGWLTVHHMDGKYVTEMSIQGVKKLKSCTGSDHLILYYDNKISVFAVDTFFGFSHKRDIPIKTPGATSRHQVSLNRASTLMVESIHEKVEPPTNQPNGIPATFAQTTMIDLAANKTHSIESVYQNVLMHPTQWICILSGKKLLKTMSCPNGACVAKYVTSATVLCLTLSHADGGMRLLSVMDDSNMRVHNCMDLRVTHTKTVNLIKATSLAISPDDKIAACHCDGFILLFTFPQLDLFRQIPDVPGDFGIKFNPAGDRLVVPTKGEILFWERDAAENAAAHLAHVKYRFKRPATAVTATAQHPPPAKKQEIEDKDEEKDELFQ
jgi:hypothetical protein